MSPEEKQVVDRLKEASNILVTVKTDPTIDQLAACLGLTLALNKAGKHATAVFSGSVPSILGFLEPEKTLEKTTDSLRDFIISLDKSKADKLRYKVEDNVVKIFITPYKTAITQDDFEYSQGDFNVEAVVALGVHNQQDLDIAITSHGRILHDATVITINTEIGADLGTIILTDERASSLSEIVTIVLQNFDKEVLDEQIATALLTGVVSETERFSNEKTTPTTMNVSSILMTAGANQKLVATKLEEHEEPTVISEPHVESISEQQAEAPGVMVESQEELSEVVPVKPKEPGVLEIDHQQDEPETVTEAVVEPEEEIIDENAGQITVDENGEIQPLTPPISTEEPQDTDTAPQPAEVAGVTTLTHGPNRMVLQPPSVAASQFTANTSSESEIQGSDIALPAVEETPAVQPQAPFSLSDALAQNAEPETLADIERSVGSTHVQPVEQPAPVAEAASVAEHVVSADEDETASLDDARRAVEDAMAAIPDTDQAVDPVQALHTEVIDFSQPQESVEQDVFAQNTIDQPQVENTFTMPQPQVQAPQPDTDFALPSLDQNQPQPVFAQPQPTVVNPNAAPPVPPPMMPPNFGNPQQ